MADWLDKARETKGRFVTIEKVDEGGSLQARCDKQDVVSIYYRAKAEGQEARVRVGRYDPKAPPSSVFPQKDGGMSLRAARAQATQKAIEHKGNSKLGGLAAKRREENTQRKAGRAEKARLSTMTLKGLCDAYADLLVTRGKIDARDARGTLTRLLASNPTLAAKPARDVSIDDLVIAIRKIHEAGKKREHGKARAYLHAAYKVALTARSNPTIPAAFVAFDVQYNPVSAIATTPVNSAKAELKADDMRQLWQVAQSTPGMKGALMQLHILTGGQRIEQLLRLKREDVHDDYIVLHDPKGRRSAPRRHIVPLLQEAQAALAVFTSAPYVFSTDGGKTCISSTTYLCWSKGAVGDAIAEFAPKRLRSGVETALASVGVSLDTRAQLQSHGLGGVQARHYDGYEYLAEKRAALQSLLDLLNNRPADNVTPIREGVAA